MGVPEHCLPCLGDAGCPLSGLQIPFFSANATAHSFSVDEEFLKQSRKPISAADSQCYPPATGFAISLSPKGAPLGPLVAMVTLQHGRRVWGCSPSQSRHTLKSDHSFHVARGFPKRIPGCAKCNRTLSLVSRRWRARALEVSAAARERLASTCGEGFTARTSRVLQYPRLLPSLVREEIPYYLQGLEKCYLRSKSLDQQRGLTRDSTLCRTPPRGNGLAVPFVRLLSCSYL